MSPPYGFLVLNAISVFPIKAVASLILTPLTGSLWALSPVPSHISLREATLRGRFFRCRSKRGGVT
ncbi:hypothetical protein CERSUDRAFT_101685 [Gelatoporia subvermispora B]|uniref:Uncharacterized protein n=1 Tax=Ceriporiopsis subvermispora (strain B) TaxID=914234 RepID=M2Q070_CERS8|nr:hypothetical protein CERSUDRAFT_101685 [Gelatoporia subvermispora B]